MSHITGVITKIFDNRLKNGVPSPYPNQKIFIGEEEFTAWTGNELPCKQGDNVSLHFKIGKTGKPFVDSDYATKALKIQVIPKQATNTSEEIQIDDDLSGYEPDHFANNGIVDNSGTNSNYGANVKKPIDKKSLEIFTIAITKSALESNQLKADKNSIASFIKEMIEVYKQSF